MNDGYVKKKYANKINAAEITKSDKYNWYNTINRQNELLGKKMM